jgi:PAT family beta-lactamase induction signal transducer AmpG
VAEINTKQTSPLGWIASTWFAMGIPFIALSSTAGIMYQSFKLPDEEVAFWTSFILLPWALKFLWGPLLEMFKNKRYFVYVSQFFLGVLFALVAVSVISDRFFGLSIGLFTAIGVSAATQDLAADGIYINELNKFQQQQFIGWQTVFQQLAKAVFGSALVLLAFQLEEVYGLKIAWMSVMIIYAVAMIVLGVISVNKLPTGGDAVHAVDSAPEAIVIYRDVLLQFLKKKNLWIGLVFIFLYRLAEAQVVKIAPFFFKASRIDGGLGIDKANTSFIFGVVGTIAFILGSLASGYFVAKKTFNRKTLFILCAIMNIPFLVYSYLAIAQPVDELPIILMIAFQQFCYGFGLMALVYYILQEIAPGKYQLAFFGFAAAAMNFAFIIPGMFSGYLSEYMGYYEFFIWVIICTIPAFIMSAIVPLTNTTEPSTAN